MLEQLVEKFGNVKATIIENQFLVHYANDIGATHLIRGLRNSADVVFEMSLTHANKRIEQSIDTVFFPAPEDMLMVSSSFVKSLVGPLGWENIVREYVPNVVLEYLKEKQYERM